MIPVLMNMHLMLGWSSGRNETSSKRNSG